MKLLASFSLRTAPLSKERPRTGKSGHVYTPKRTQDYEQAIRSAAIGQLPEGHKVPSGPVKLVVHTQNAVPKSWNKKDRAAALRHELYPKRGDVDNRAKAVQDALNGVFYLDDAQIVEVVARKQYGETDQVYAAVYALDARGSNEEDYGSSAGMGEGWGAGLSVQRQEGSAD